MSTQAERMQLIWREYELAGNPTPAPLHDVAQWAINEGLWRPKPADVFSQCVSELANGLRQDYFPDGYGRRVRAKHAARIDRGGEQLVMWADIRTAPRNHMELAFKQRRQQIVSDCRQLQIDVDSYNENHPKEKPVQMAFNFTMDLQELEMAAKRGGSLTFLFPSSLSR